MFFHCHEVVLSGYFVHFFRWIRLDVLSGRHFVRIEDFFFYFSILELLTNYLDWTLLLDYFEDPLRTTGVLGDYDLDTT